MSIAALIRRMSEAGATPEAIALAVEAIEALNARDEERKAKQRERTAKHRAASRDSNVTVTAQSRDSNEDSSSPLDGPLSLPQTPTQSPLNPPTSTPQEGAVADVIVPFPIAKPRKPERGTRLPADWKPSAELIEFARTEGLTDDQANREFASFRDYWIAASGANAVKRDWTAAARNWLRKAATSFSSPSRPQPIGHRPASGGRFAAMQRALARLDDTNAFP